jgi:hypothetical protein
VGLPEDAIEHVKVLRDHKHTGSVCQCVTCQKRQDACDALIGMLPQEFSDSECARWANTVWDYTPDPLSIADLYTAREELTRLHAGGGHLTWDPE